MINEEYWKGYKAGIRSGKAQGVRPVTDLVIKFVHSLPEDQQEAGRRLIVSIIDVETKYQDELAKSWGK